MSPRRRQERRRCRQPLAASRCAPHPGMARHGTARPGRRRSRREPAVAAAAPLSHGGAAHAQRRGGAPAASEPFPRRCPRIKRRRAPAGRGCASRRRRGRGAGLERGAASQTKIAGEEEEEEKEEEKKYTARGERERENSSPFPSPTGKTGGNAPAPEHCWKGTVIKNMWLVSGAGRWTGLLLCSDQTSSQQGFCQLLSTPKQRQAHE
nr:uncharacterized protein LOC113459197 isoform X2 [Zonotrichia albicollis]